MGVSRWGKVSTVPHDYERGPPQAPRHRSSPTACRVVRCGGIATWADLPAAPGAHRVSGAVRRPLDARMRGRGQTDCPPRLPRPQAVRRCRLDRRTDRTMRAAWPGNTAPGATRSTRRHISSPCWVITKNSEVILAFGVSALAHAVAAHRVCVNLSGTSSLSASNLSTSALPVRGYASRAGLKYRWKISPKKSYGCSLIAVPPRFQTEPPLCARSVS